MNSLMAHSMDFKIGIPRWRQTLRNVGAEGKKALFSSNAS